jgi:heavy metal translocating P-type ATPase
LSTDLLLLTGVLAAYAFSVVSIVRGAGHVYFEVACVILVLVTLGRWLEANGRAEATAALTGMAQLLPATARVAIGQQLVERPVRDVKPGDRLCVLAGERLPCDGRVTDSDVEIDEQIVTGESWPRLRHAGDRAWAGTLNLTEPLWLEVDTAPEDGLLARLVGSIRQALATKGRLERQADRLAGVFIPLVIAIACTAGVWHGVTQGVDAGILTGLAVVVIACPCALGLATPLATWTALGRAGQAGMLVRSGEALESLARIRALRFDKTGTLTTGRPELAQVVLADENDAPEALALAWALTAGASHVHAQAIRSTLPRPARQVALEEVVTHVGRGLSARSPAHGMVYLGSEGFLSEHGQEIAPDWRQRLNEHYCLAAVFLGWGGKARAFFGLTEELRQGARLAIKECLELGLDVAVLTGDRPVRADWLARELSLRVLGMQLPEAKVTAIHEAQRVIGPVAMVGDGLNDAAAMAASDAGIAMGCGADLTRTAAGVCLLGNDLAKLPGLIGLARQTVHTIRLNLFWACAYNVMGIGLAATGRLNPIWAALAMVLSSGFVIGNTLRLRQHGFNLPAETPRK